MQLAVPWSNPALEPSGTAPVPGLVQLLAGASRGDEAAFGTFYDLTSPRVYGMVLRVLRDAAQTAEVVQDVYLDVWQHSARFDSGRSGALPWLLMIAHRRAVDRVRSAQSAIVRDDKYAALHTDCPYDSVTEHVLSSIEGRWVRTALAELSAPQRQAIILAYFGGHTHAEVATLLGVPLGTVKTRIRDGLIRLRQHIPQPVDCPPGPRPSGEAGARACLSPSR